MKFSKLEKFTSQQTINSFSLLYAFMQVYYIVNRFKTYFTKKVCVCMYMCTEPGLYLDL